MKKSQYYSIKSLLWLIAAALSHGWFYYVAGTFTVIDGLMSIYYTFTEE